MCSHELWASNTSSRGASKTRVMTIFRPGVSIVCLYLPFPPIALLLSVAWPLAWSASLELVQVLVQSVVALVPEATVSVGPLGDLLERGGAEPRGPPLPLPPPRDEAGSLQHLEVLRDRGQAHLEGLRQLGHRGLALRQTREDGASGRIRQGPERAIQPIGDVHHSILRLIN